MKINVSITIIITKIIEYNLFIIYIMTSIVNMISMNINVINNSIKYNNEIIIKTSMISKFSINTKEQR